MRTWLFGICLALLSTAAFAGPRLAVLDFEVSSADASHAALGAGMRSMLATDLSKAPDVVIVEREQLEAVLAELKLQSGKAVDDKTAVQVGRLLGATHLVDGSVTVQGEVMRLDVRLIDVERGTVALGEAVQGERLAFFELEKDLVKKLVVGLAVQLAPKQRASIGKVHTADWEAFVAFSEGVAAFDQDRYEQALAALDKALAVDGEFDLAELTGKEFAAIVARLEQREEDLQTAKIEADKLEKSEEAAAALSMLARLEALAEAEGEAARADRLTALSMLAGLYGEGGPPALRTEIDSFQADRLSDHYVRRYVAEVQPLWGSWAPDPRSRMNVSPERFDRRFAELRGQVTYSRYTPDKLPRIASRDLDNCTSSSSWGRALLLDLGERVDRCLARGKVGAAVSEDPDYASRFAWSIASSERRAGRFDDAVRHLLVHAESLEDPRRVKGVRQQIESLRAYEQAIDGSARPDRVREVLVGRGSGYLMDRPMHEVAPEHVGPERMTPIGRYLLGSVRNLANRRDSLSHEPYLLIGDEPLWVLGGLRAFSSGPRPDPVRTETLAYYRPAGGPDPSDVRAIRGPARALYGARPRSTFELSMVVHHVPDSDWWPSDVRFRPGMRGHDVEPGRAAVELLIGARDVRVLPRRVPGEKSEVHRPFRAWVVRFDDEEVRLERLVQTQPAHERNYARERITSQKRRDPRAEVTEVRLSVDAGEVVVRLNGRSYRFTIDEPVAGYPGFFMTDEGYARFENVKLD